MELGKEFLYESAVVIERALKSAAAVREKVESDAEIAKKTELKKSCEKTTGYIFTPQEVLDKMEPTINKVILTEFNNRKSKYSDFVEFLLTNGYAENAKKADNLAHNKIKVLRENCDQKFSNIVLLCKFLNIQLDFIIN